MQQSVGKRMEEFMRDCQSHCGSMSYKNRPWKNKGTTHAQRENALDFWPFFQWEKHRMHNTIIAQNKWLITLSLKKKRKRTPSVIVIRPSSAGAVTVVRPLCITTCSNESLAAASQGVALFQLTGSVSGRPNCNGLDLHASPHGEKGD